MNLKEIEEFARIAHEGQKRRFSGKPYIEHPLAVKRLLEVAGVVDDNVLAAALLHDVVEDTKYTLDDVEKVSDQWVAFLVSELTLVYNGEEEKDILLKMFKDKRIESLTIKVADRICNTVDFLDHDPYKAQDYYSKSKVIFSIFNDRKDDMLDEDVHEFLVRLAVDVGLCCDLMVMGLKHTEYVLEKMN